MTSIAPATTAASSFAVLRAAPATPMAPEPPPPERADKLDEARHALDTL
jgi:hypothetical protein